MDLGIFPPTEIQRSGDIRGSIPLFLGCFPGSSGGSHGGPGVAELIASTVGYQANANAVTRGFKKPHRLAFEWSAAPKIGANRAGPRPGPFPSLRRAGLGREAAQKRRFPLLPRKKTKQNLKPLLTAVEECCDTLTSAPAGRGEPNRRHCGATADL